MKDNIVLYPQMAMMSQHQFSVWTPNWTAKTSNWKGSHKEPNHYMAAAKDKALRTAKQKRMVK